MKGHSNTSGQTSESHPVVQKFEFHYYFPRNEQVENRAIKGGRTFGYIRASQQGSPTSGFAGNFESLIGRNGDSVQRRLLSCSTYQHLVLA